MEIYLVRHTKVNIAKDICYGQADIGLASSFQEEASKILKNLPDTSGYTCYTSPLTRCKLLTDKMFCKEIITDPRLMELNFGDWELKSWDSIGKQEFDAWHCDFVNNRTPNGESYFQLYTRAISLWKEIILKRENVILISHGGVIRALLSYCLGLPLENSFRLKIDYGSISKIILNGDFLTVEYVNR